MFSDLAQPCKNTSLANCHCICPFQVMRHLSTTCQLNHAYAHSEEFGKPLPPMVLCARKWFTYQLSFTHACLRSNWNLHYLYDKTKETKTKQNKTLRLVLIKWMIQLLWKQPYPSLRNVQWPGSALQKHFAGKMPLHLCIPNDEAHVHYMPTESYVCSFRTGWQATPTNGAVCKRMIYISTKPHFA